MTQAQQLVSNRYNKIKLFVKNSDQYEHVQVKDIQEQQHIASQHQLFMPHVPQAGNNGDVGFGSSNGWINASKSSNVTTNNITYNTYCSKPAWHQTFKEWIDKGNYKRAAGVGFVIGAIGGYGLHAVMTPGQKEKIIVVQAQSEKN